MRWTRPIITTVLATLAVTTALSTVPGGADAQLARRRPTERALFLTPSPDSQDDSLYAVELAERVRNRMEARLRSLIITIPSTDICRVLEESGFPCSALLNPADAERLAQAMRADAYVMGDMWREEEAPLARFRMVDVRRTGLSGWMTVQGTDDAAMVDFAETIIDSLEHQLEAAGYARQCLEERDRGDFTDAMERAQRAFAIYPNHPSAAMCAEVVSEVMQQPLDSQIAVLERAVRGDSLLARGWERLGRLYRQRGDSLRALAAFAQQSRSRPADRQLRKGVVAGAITVGVNGLARDLADEWLAVNQGDLEMLQLKARACVEGALWDCALDALSVQYDLDSTLVGDAVFYQQIIGAAQSLGNTEAQLEWSGEAVRQLPESISLWRAHASALASAEADTTLAVETRQAMLDSVVAVYDLLIERDSTDVRSALSGATILLDGLVIDTAVTLDIARLLKAGEFLGVVTAASRDTAVLMNVAVKYYEAGRALVQTQQLFTVGVEWLEHSLENDVLARLTQPVNFFLGLGLMFRIFEFDPQVTASESCELVEQEAEMIARGKRAMTLGAQISPSTANQILARYQNMEARIPNLRRAYECR